MMSPPTSSIIVIIILFACITSSVNASLVFSFDVFFGVLFLLLCGLKKLEDPTNLRTAPSYPQTTAGWTVGHCGRPSVCWDGCIRTANDVTVGGGQLSVEKLPASDPTRHHSPLKPTLWLTARTCSPSDSFEWLRIGVARVCRGRSCTPGWEYPAMWLRVHGSPQDFSRGGQWADLKDEVPQWGPDFFSK